MSRVRPGFAFTIVCDLGLAVALVTHQVPRMGDLVWLAGPIFDDQPSLDDVASIGAWRWPVFFPTGAAVRRRLVHEIGIVEIPTRLVDIPRMRGGNRSVGWREVRFGDQGQELVGPDCQRAWPISQIVNDTRLKEMLIAGWVPSDMW